jgi:predicted AlkP superfamily pyrophosphatase or phosphodiesterase
MDTTATNSMAPHAAGQHPIASQFYEWLRDTPFLDALTLDVARLAVQSEKLGADDTPDLLLIGLSATDLVGHTYGPLSQESEDNLLRLDAELAKFFDFLEATVGLKNCVLALSADHGVLPLPEELRRRGFEAARIPQAEALDEVKSVQGEMQQEWRTNRPILRTFLWNVNLDYTVAESLRLSPAEFRSRVAAKLRSLSFVNDVFTYDELNATNNKTREYLDQTRHSFHPERSPDLAMQIKPFYLVSNSPHGTTHGSVYEYDSHVPLILWGERVKPGRVESPVKTVDLAPTLAHLLDLELTADLQRRVTNGRPGSAQIASVWMGKF